MNRPVKKEWLEPFRAQAELGAKDYESSFDPVIPRRTALNRLNRLMQEGFVERQGQGPSTIYRLTEAGSARLTGRAADDGAATPPRSQSRLSDEAEALRAEIKRPVAERDPVGYEQGFLDAYQPNQTFYLPENVRRNLQETGSQTGMADEPGGTYARHICQRLLIDLLWNSSRLDSSTATSGSPASPPTCRSSGATSPLGRGLGGRGRSQALCHCGRGDSRRHPRGEFRPLPHSSVRI